MDGSLEVLKGEYRLAIQLILSEQPGKNERLEGLVSQLQWHCVCSFQENVGMKMCIISLL